MRRMPGATLVYAGKGGKPVEEVVAWFRNTLDRYAAECGLVECQVLFSGNVTRRDARRVHHTEHEALKLLEQQMAETGITTYEEYGYRFDFAGGNYTWNGKEVYLTPGERRHCWSMLVSGVISNQSRQFLRNARKRLGREFLQEALG